MKTRRIPTLQGAIALLPLTLLTVLPAHTRAADQSAQERELVMSFDEMLTSGSTLDGDVTLTGAVAVRGMRHEDFVVTGANSDGSEVYIRGTATVAASGGGTINMSFIGTIHFDNATFQSTLLAYVEGRESITGGTGAYAGVTGRGTFAATLDYTTGKVRGVYEAKLMPKR